MLCLLLSCLGMVLVLLLCWLGGLYRIFLLVLLRLSQFGGGSVVFTVMLYVLVVLFLLLVLCS